ncbi:MAG: hypothetical protein ACKVW3_05580 [Phycisphaerales bacterium]
MPDSIRPISTKQHWWRHALPTLAFASALLFVGGFFLLGRIGFWSDDYWHARIDPATGARTALAMERGFFLRPLFFRVVPAVTTLCWRHDWLAHAIVLCSHAVVCVLLWRLLRVMGVSARSAAAAVTVYMVYPGSFEAMMWVAALPTSMAASLMLGVMLLMVLARRVVLATLISAAMVFAACCLNEQPAAGVMVLPVLGWVVGKGRRDEGTEGRSRGRVQAAISALWPTMVLGLVVLAYVLLVMLDGRAPRGARGSAESLVSIADLQRRVEYFVDVLWRRMVLRNFWRGALGEGFRTVTGSGAYGWAALGMLAATGAAWWRWFARTGTGASSWTMSPESIAASAGDPTAGAGCRARDSFRLFRLVVLGVAVFVTGWVPIVLTASYEPDPRLRYWPCVGLAIVIGAALDVVRGRRARMVAGAAVATTACVFAVMLVGTQQGFANRWRMDQAEMAAIRMLVPNPPPYAYFIPLRVENTALSTGSPVLDRHFRAVWEFPWTTTPHVQRAYGRADIAAGYFRHWTPRAPVRGANERGVLLTDEIGPRYGTREVSGAEGEARRGGWRVPWDRVVLFVVERGGEVRLVGRVEAGGQGFDVPLGKGGVAVRLERD